MNKAGIYDAIDALEMEGFNVYDYGGSLQVSIDDTTRAPSGWVRKVDDFLLDLVAEIVNEYAYPAYVYDSGTAGIMVVEFE